jgi:hypothetical protein
MCFLVTAGTRALYHTIFQICGHYPTLWDALQLKLIVLEWLFLCEACGAHLITWFRIKIRILIHNLMVDFK